MLTTILHHPRRLWLRKAMFQVHLWLGILLSLYVVVISLSGATLVFEDEIRTFAMRDVHYDAARIAPFGQVMAQAKEHFPEEHLSYIAFPQKSSPRWGLYFEDANGKSHTVYADIYSGVPVGNGGQLFIDWVLDLHVFLLMGRTGFVANCIAGIGLLVLAITGAILWWPGVRRWRRSLGVSMRGSWKRINYDVHSAVGFWTLFIVSWWGFTAVCFLFPEQVKTVVNAVAPLQGMQEPRAAEVVSAAKIASLESILDQQSKISPGFLSGISLPQKPGGKVTLYIDRRLPGDFSHRDIDTFDGHTGQLLSVWHYGENRTVGDWLLWLVYPLHFGTLWGLPVKVLWALLGVSLATLSVTGVLMYWNRCLKLRWHLLQNR